MVAALVSLPWAVIVVLLLVFAHRERAAGAIERATLLQRIQAPDVAIGQHVYESDPEPDEEPDDDDPAFINIP